MDRRSFLGAVVALVTGRFCRGTDRHASEWLAKWNAECAKAKLPGEYVTLKELEAAWATQQPDMIQVVMCRRWLAGSISCIR